MKTISKIFVLLLLNILLVSNVLAVENGKKNIEEFLSKEVKNCSMPKNFNKVNYSEIKKLESCKLFLSFELKKLNKNEFLILFREILLYYPRSNLIFSMLSHFGNYKKIFKLAKETYSNNKILSLAAFNYLIENDFLIKDIKSDPDLDGYNREIFSILNQNEKDFINVNLLNSNWDHKRQKKCYDLLIYNKNSKKKDIEKKVVKRILDGDDILIPCIFLYHIVSKQMIKSKNLLKKVNWYPKYSRDVIDHFYFRDIDEEAKYDFKKAFDETYPQRDKEYIISKTLNKIYNINYFSKTNKNLKLNSKDKKNLNCLQNLEFCLQNDNKIEELKPYLTNLIKIVYIFQLDQKIFFNYFDKIFFKTSIPVETKLDLLYEITFGNFYFQDDFKKKIKKYQLSAKLQFWENYSQIFSLKTNEQITKKASIELEYWMELIKGNPDIGEELYKKNYFQKNILLISSASSKPFLKQITAWLRTTILSDYKDYYFHIANNLISRVRDLYGKNNNLYLEILWIQTYIEFKRPFGNPYVKILEALEISKDNSDYFYRFSSFKSQFLLESGNINEALTNEQTQFTRIKNLTFNKIKLIDDQIKNIKGKYVTVSFKKSLIYRQNIEYFRLCNEALEYSKFLRSINKKDNNIIKEYCFKYYDKIKRFPVINFIYLMDALIQEGMDIDAGNKTKISKDLMLKIDDLLKNNELHKKYKAPLIFFKMVYENKKNEDALSKETLEIFEYINSGKSTYTIEDDVKVLLYFKLLEIAEKFKGKNKETFTLYILKEINKIIRTNLSSQGYIQSVKITKTKFISDILAKISNKILVYKNNKQILSEYFEFQNLLKYDVPEKIIFAKSLNNNKDKKVTSLLSRQKFLTDTLFIKNIETKNKNILFNELNNIETYLKKIKLNQKSKVKLLSLSKIQENLNENELYLNYKINYQSNSIDLFSITKKNVTLDSINGLDTLIKTISSFKLNILKKNNSKIKEHGFYIFQKLIKKNLSDKITKIIITPHNELYELPYHALYMEKPEKSLSNYFNQLFSSQHKWLGMNYEIEILNVATKNKIKDDNKTYSFAGIGNPSSNSKEIKENMIAQLGSLDTSSRGITEVIKKFSPLPFAEKELKEISKLKIFDKTKLFLKSDASEENIKSSKFIENASVISFATHGILEGKMNSFSEPGLILSHDKSNKENGFLTMSEIANLNLKSEIVILSACNSANSLNNVTSAFSGLASAFIAAGSDTVLASHWSINDESTYRLIKSIFKFKVNNKNWSKAQLEGIREFVRKNKRFSSPFYWAPFILYSVRTH